MEISIVLCSVAFTASMICEDSVSRYSRSSGSDGISTSLNSPGLPLFARGGCLSFRWTDIVSESKNLRNSRSSSEGPRAASSLRKTAGIPWDLAARCCTLSDV